MVFVREAHIYRRITFIKDLIYTNNISDIRKDRKISQDKMAEEIGISRRTLSKIENSDQNLSLEMAYRIAIYFDMLVPEMFLLQDLNREPSFKS